MNDTMPNQVVIEGTPYKKELYEAAPDLYKTLIEMIDLVVGEQEAEDELEKAWGKSGRYLIERARKIVSDIQSK